MTEIAYMRKLQKEDLCPDCGEVLCMGELVGNKLKWYCKCGFYELRDLPKPKKPLKDREKAMED